MEQIEIYKKLKQMRKERGLTLNTLAEKIGSDYQQLSRIERGKSKLSIEMLMKMANALETPLTEIVQEPVFEKKAAATLPPSHSSLSQDMLTSILERIEGAAQEAHAALSPSIKASLTSQIYRQALQIYQEKNDAALAKQFIEFSTSLIKTMAQQ
jgi:transcriptional regulator with XRE-family HTH domain